MSEITPIRLRGKFIICIGIFTTIGSIFGWFVVYMIDESFTEGNFRKVFTFLSICPFISVLMTFICFIESPRLLLASKKDKLAFKHINEIGKRNDKNF